MRKRYTRVRCSRNAHELDAIARNEQQRISLCRPLTCSNETGGLLTDTPLSDPCRIMSPLL
jgi:hypothetical protein